MQNLRPELTQHLLSRIYSFQKGFHRNIALIGPPGSGKTFQLQQVLTESFPNIDILYCPVYNESLRSLLNRILQSVLLRALDEPPHAEPGDQLLKRALKTRPKTARAVDQAQRALRQRHYYESFTRTLESIRILVEEKGQPCVFVIDEFQNLESLRLGHVFHELGKRVMTWPATLFVLSSSTPYKARKILQERFQLLFGQFEVLELNGLDEQKARQWLYQELSRLDDVKEASDFLLKWVGPYPWYLSLFVKRLNQSCEIEYIPLSTKSLIAKVAWDVLGVAEGPLYQWCQSRVNRLVGGPRGGRALEVLLQVAAGSRTMTEMGKRIGRSSVSTSLQMLLEMDLVERRGVCWWVPDPVFRFWLNAVIGAERHQVLENPDQQQKRFESMVESLWERWIGVKRLSFEAQVVKLISSFEDDTLSIGDKTGRLPVFSSIRKCVPHELQSLSHYLIADSKGKRWCLGVEEHTVTEAAISRFDAFCRMQVPRPTRKVIVTHASLSSGASVLAKSLNIWVWVEQDITILSALYGNKVFKENRQPEMDSVCLP